MEVLVKTTNIRIGTKYQLFMKIDNIFKTQEVTFVSTNEKSASF